MKISIIIPARNEAENIGRLLCALQPYRDRGHEVIVVDGGSEDDTIVIAAALADTLLQTPAGRSHQMNAGSKEAKGEILWFLHADSELPEQADGLIISAVTTGAYTWGRFDVRLSGRQKLLRVVEKMMNLRSRMTGIATGDQGIFISRKLFEKAGGYPDQLLMEDIALCKHLKKYQNVGKFLSIEELANNYKFIIYCNGKKCHRSSYGACLLRTKIGVPAKNVYLMLGGFPEWKAAGYPVR